MKITLYSDDPVFLSEALIEDTARFHGHLGPFLILGLMAGAFANKILGKDSFKTKAVITTEPHPPYSCFIDGVQVATGCTMGKGNIKLMDGEGLEVTFTKGSKKLELCLKDDILDELRNIPKDELVEIATKLKAEPVKRLFDLRISTNV